MAKVKAAVSIALLMLGLATWDAVLNHDPQDSAVIEDVQALDGLPWPK